jgi:hypothetical protein
MCVRKIAPVIYLYSKEKYNPSDILAQLQNTIPKFNLDALADSAAVSSLSLSNLSVLNPQGNGGVDIYLTAKDDITRDPPWLLGVVPSADGSVGDAKTNVVIVAEKEAGVVDVFYVNFYAYNWGGKVLGLNWGYVFIMTACNL